MSTSNVVGPTDQIMVELHHVNYSVGPFQILRNVSVQARAGAATCILGTSGAGKSTVLKLVLGLIKAESGEIFVDSENITHLTETELMPVRRKIGMVFQEGALFDSLTVKENVGYGDASLLSTAQFRRHLIDHLLQLH